MNYLKEYNITDIELNNIINNLEEKDLIDLFTFNKEKITKILDLFKNIGVTKFYDIIMTNPYLFNDTVLSIDIRIKEFNNNKRLADLINEDALNMNLANLL